MGLIDKQGLPAGAFRIAVKFKDSWSAANHFYKQGLFADALEALRPLIAEPQPGVAPATFALNVARCLRSLRRCDEAEPWFEQALVGGRLDARWEYASQCLLRGRFTPGWGHYEQRLPLFGAAALHIQPYAQPLWQGQPLEGKTLLVHGEQGYGDEIMFASMVVDLIARAGRVVLACSPTLHPLFERSFPGAIVVASNRGAPAPAGSTPAWLPSVGRIDYQIPCGSLAQLLRGDASAFPHRAYLQPDEIKVAHWKQRLGAMKTGDDRFLVGLAWADNRANGANGAKADRKSIPLHLLLPLSEVAGVRLIALVSPGQVSGAEAVPQMRMIDVHGDLKDHDDSAALIAALDLVITIDNGVAHIAGALGQRTLLALSHGADWRWGEADRDAWWYPEVRITRQGAPGDWVPVVASLVAQLRECVGEPRLRPVKGQPVRNVLLATEHGSMIVDRHELALQSGIASMLASQGAYEPEEMSLLREMISFLPRGTVVLDIGAHIGAHTLEFARSTQPAGGMVHAFEADRMRFQMLGGNLAMNNHLNVECHHLALGATPGEFVMPGPDGSTRVRQVRLDSLALPRVELMRISAGGLEVGVLQGGMETIGRCKPLIFVDTTRSGEALTALLLQLGYQVFVMNARNFICVHPRRELVSLSGLVEVTPRPPVAQRAAHFAPQMATH